MESVYLWKDKSCPNCGESLIYEKNIRTNKNNQCSYCKNWFSKDELIENNEQFINDKRFKILDEILNEILNDK